MTSRSMRGGRSCAREEGFVGKRLIKVGVVLALTSGCGGFDASDGASDEAAAVSQQAFRANILGVHFPGTSHESITRSGLPFLDADLVDDLAVFNEDTDSGDTQYDSAYHTDNCRLSEAFLSVRRRYGNVVNGIGDGLIVGSMYEFGTILHTTQDFYAHSNWVDAGQRELVTANSPFEFPDASPGTFLGTPLGSVVTLATGIPSNWSVTLPSRSRKPTANTGDGTVVGIITGTYSDNTDGPSACPAQASIPHGPFFTGDLAIDEYLSKDDPNSINHDLARDAAARQTTEEFCRLARLVLLRKGVARYEELLGSLVANRSQYEAMCPNARGMVTALTTVAL